MRVTLHTPGGVAVALGTDAHAATFAVKCPACKAGPPLRVGGAGIRSHTHDTHIAEAHCLACKHHLGQLHARVDTIFGIEEDRRVLQGRCRVY